MTVASVPESSVPRSQRESGIARVLRRSERVLASTIPWLALFVVFLAVNAYVHRLWIWDIGDDQNLMMPAINIGRGYTPNIDFASGYPGLTFYVQRLVMVFTGESPFSEHVYTALQAGFFGGVAAWALRKWYPPALVWLLVVFLWTGSHALNPTPNPGYVVQALVLLTMVLTERLGHEGRLVDAAGAGALAGLAFLFKQYGLVIPVGFVLYTSFAVLASPNWPSRLWLRASIVLLNVAILAAYCWVYLVRSVFIVPHTDPQAAAGLPLSTAAFLLPWVFALACLAVLAVRPRPLLARGLTVSAAVKVNAAFAGAFVAIGIVGFALMYGIGPNSVTALQTVLFDAPKLINGNIKPLQPFQLWPEVAVTCLVIMGPLMLRELRNPALRAAMLIGIAGVVLYSARTYTNSSETLAPTLAFFLLVATFLFTRPTGDTWSWFFVFVAGSTMLAYLVPYPAYMFNMGILVVSGWAMIGGTFQPAWPRLVNPLGAVALAAILALVLLDGSGAMDRMTTYPVGSHLIKSYDPQIAPAVNAANGTTELDAQQELHVYLNYLAHAR